jgi:prepilin-type N-terminal cleavage/methylation domain-containing protein
MKKSHGFTLLEASAVMGIVGIMATVTVKSSQKIVAQTELQATTMNLLSELKATRPVALKNDAQVMVKFIAAQCSIYVDQNGNGARDAGELVTVYKIPPQASLGIASNGPSSAPATGIDYDASGIAGNWKTGSMTVSNDARGSINSGAIYLRESRLPQVTYCIGISSSMRSLQLYKWERSSWIKL